MDRWWEKAACAGADTDIFFPLGKKGRKKEDDSNTPEVIKLFCERCPVRSECFDEAMSVQGINRYDKLYGIWGGTTEYTRRKIMRESKGSA